MKLSRRFKAVCVAATVIIGSAGCALAAIHLNNNFHVIVKDEAYRSAQPSADQIRAYREKYHIATIINLRGKSDKAAWYSAEVSTANALGIRHIDFAMSPRRELTQAQSLALIDLMKSAPKPILIHCHSGSDRTGLASALYLAAVAKEGEAKSEKQLSIRFGHFAIPVIGTYDMDRTFEAMEPILGFSGS